MLPAFGVNKSKRAEEKLRREQEEQVIRGKNAKEREDFWEKRNQRVAKYNFNDDNNSSSKGKQRERHNTTPQGINRDANELEIDSNLDQISSGLSRLKMMSHAMNEELDGQTEQIQRISERTDRIGGHVAHLNNKMEKSGLIKNRKGIL